LYRHKDFFAEIEHVKPIGFVGRQIAAYYDIVLYLLNFIKMPCRELFSKLSCLVMPSLKPSTSKPNAAVADPNTSASVTLKANLFII
jgi:hypothetical protein